LPEFAAPAARPALVRAPHPALRELVSQAARALAELDAGRLEELALSCQALNRDLNSGTLPIKEAERLAAEAREARRDMAIFARVLEATRANVEVIERLRELRSGRVEYTLNDTAGRKARWPAKENTVGAMRPTENRHGND
jgi:hypothetical protein